MSSRLVKVDRLIDFVKKIETQAVVSSSSGSKKSINPVLTKAER